MCGNSVTLMIFVLISLLAPAKALYWAARKGHLEVVQCLLNHGANVNLTGAQTRELVFWNFVTDLTVTPNHVDHYLSDCWLCASLAFILACICAPSLTYFFCLTEQHGSTALHGAAQMGHKAICSACCRG